MAIRPEDFLAKIVAKGAATPAQLAQHQRNIAANAAAGKPPPTPTPSYTAAVYSTSSTESGAAVAAANVAAAAAAAVEKRRQEMAFFTGWDNHPDLRKYQEQAWNIYVNTGRWDTPEQQALHKAAEEMRKGMNPMYNGLPWGPENKQQANMISLQPDTSALLGGNAGGLAIIAVGIMALFAFARS